MRGKLIKRYFLYVLIITIMIAGCEGQEEAAFQVVSEEDLDEEGVSGEEAETENEAVIFVHVCGQVENPGVYEFDYGSRVYEAIEAAGGMTKAAAADSLNQAQLLSDGQQLYVPSEEELANEASSEGSTGKVNINKASKEELMTLSGIGEAKADAIIRYRKEQGSFKSIEDIMEIEGIKEGVFRKIEDQITVS